MIVAKLYKNNRYLLELSVVTTVLLLLNDIGKIPTISYYVTAPLLLVSLVYCLRRGFIRNRNCIFFLIVLPISIILGGPDPVFRSWERLAFFVIVYLIASPLYSNKTLATYRKNCFIIFLFCCSIIGIISFFAYFLGISWMTVDEDTALLYGEKTLLYMERAGYFSGITKQSMMLGPIAGLGALLNLIEYLHSKRKIFLLPLFFCIGSCMFAASRSAFIALLISILYMLYREYGLSRFVRLLIACTIVGSLSFPLWKGALLGLSMKQEVHADDTELFDSRSEKYENRANEFISSPIWGIGFAAIDTTSGEAYNTRTGTIEPGTSWLAILSMTGILGFALFVSIIANSYKGILKRKDPYSCLLLCCLILMMIHWNAEGYIFSAGNPLCFFSWLVIGCGCDFSNGMK